MLKGLSEKSNESMGDGQWTRGMKVRAKKDFRCWGAVLGILERTDHKQVHVGLTILVGVCLSN